MSLGSLILSKQLGFYGRAPTIYPIVEQKRFSCLEIGLPNIYYALDSQRMRIIWIKLLPLLGQGHNSATQPAHQGKCNGYSAITGASLMSGYNHWL